MDILSVIVGLFKPAMQLIDKFTLSKEEKMQLSLEMEKIQAAAAAQALELQARKLELEGELLKSKSSIIVAEAQGESWLQRNWRPLIMMLFGFIIANNYVVAPVLEAIIKTKIVFDIPPDMWTLMQLGLSGYVLSRGLEKSLKIYKNGTSIGLRRGSGE